MTRDAKLRRTTGLLLAGFVLACGASGLAGSVRAEPVPSDRIEALEQRIQELEDGEPSAGNSLADWTQRVKLGGSANAGYYWGETDSTFHEDTFQVWDARFFIDAELGEGLEFRRKTLLRNAGLSFEWNLVRLGRLENDVGELYIDFQGIADTAWLNLQVGRMQIPVGENYLRFGKGFANNPFISNTVGGPWFWDEGMRLYGSSPNSRFGYVASVMDAENDFNVDRNTDNQYTVKIWAKPTSWLHLSVSGLHTGKIGSKNSSAEGSLWLGEAWARQFGSGTTVTNYIGGVAVPQDGPKRLEETNLVGADAIITLPEMGRLWLAYGTYAIDQKGGLYDRRLHYWVAEVILEGSLVTPEARDFYLGLRADGIGTYDSKEGYLLDVRRARTLGYNMKSLTAYSAVVGWRVFRLVTLRVEYTHQDIDLVRGTDASIRRHTRDIDSAAIEVGVHF
jgi:hypothetical protein